MKEQLKTLLVPAVVCSAAMVITTKITDIVWDRAVNFFSKKKKPLGE